MASSDYAPTEIDGQMCVWLQAVGFHRAKPLGEVKVGDILVYNYGSTSTVVEVRRVGKSSVAMTVESNGKRYETNARRASTLVATK